MEKRDIEENSEDMVYILSLLKNVKSPNRFTDEKLKGDTEGCLTTSSNTSAGMEFNDDSNTNDNNSHSSGGDFAEEQMVDNFNKVKTGHKLDDYILSILKSENCKKNFYFENDTDVNPSLQSSNTIKVSANCETDTDVSKGNQDSSEASGILYEHCFPSHELDEVLQVALKIVKPSKTHTAKVPSSEKGKSAKITASDKLNSKSASKYICSVCKFAFNSEDNKNRHMSNEHIKRISKRNPWKLRKNTSQSHKLTVDWKLRKNTNQSHKLTVDICKTADIHAYSNVNIDHKMRKELRKGSWKDTCTSVKVNGLSFEKDTGYSGHTSSISDVEGLTDSESTSGSFPCRVEISDIIRNSDLGQCCRTKTFSEHMTLLNKNWKKGEENYQCEEIVNQSNTNNLVCHESDGNTNNKSGFSHNNLNSFSSEDSCPHSGNSNISLSSSSASLSAAAGKITLQPTLSPCNAHLSSFEPALPPQLPASSVHVPSSFLREKHWIINDTSNKFEGPHSIDEKKQQGILIKSEDLVGIRSIDKSHKTSSLTQFWVTFSDGSNSSLENVSSLNRKCSMGSSNIYVKNCQVSIHSSASKESEWFPNNATTTKGQGSENVGQEWKSTCARHMTILDYLSNYDSFKLLTFKNKSSLPMEPSESEMYSQNLNSTKEKKDISDSHLRDLILSPPKKRWKSYISQD
ncbi:uncharacterized protein LOC125681687 [Ostrea edulis]|uniref:uncharacterized protein LOC125681687 n=1 Tax=Ostrea edulis TaxID=37623 RepID=UPI0024AF5F80|nr:uncharacterized protein LOC125681687 [Ostrea edulis]